MKNRIAIVAALCIILTMSMTTNAKAAEVTDISNYWAGTTIQAWVDKGFVLGYPDGKFRPNNNISRAEFVTLINKAYGYSEKRGMTFTDVRIGDWFYNALSVASAAGYISGYPDKTMKPNNPITREEAAAIIMKIEDLQANPIAANTFKDASTITWSKGAIGAVVKAKIMFGYEDGTFKAQSYISRGESVVSLDRASGISEINIKDYGAKGNGITDDTAAINNAIKYASERGGATINIPDGTYLVNPLTKISLRSNVKLHLSNNAVLKSMATSTGSYNIINIWQASDVEITGGKIVGDRWIHNGTTGEWGFGISMFGCKNVYIADISISDCWGDGIYIGSAVNATVPSVMYCDNILIERVRIDNCRRDNISVISAKNLTIKNCILSKANGNRPEAGLNFEPNYENEYMQNVVIENLLTSNNAGYGIQLGYTMRNLATPVDITIINHTDTGSLTAIGPWPLGTFERNHVVIK